MAAEARPVPQAEPKSVRKELRMRPSDAQLIHHAASVSGLSETDFMTQAAVARAVDVVRPPLVSVLPPEAFAAFEAAIAEPGKFVPGLAAAARASSGLLEPE